MRCGEFVGRREELAVLAQALCRAGEGQGSWITVLGEAGIGKSRLTAEFSRRVVTSGGRIVVGRCSPIDRSTPYRMLGEALIVAARDIPRPDHMVALGPYLPAVERFVPHWSSPSSGLVNESPAIVGESILRVLSWLAGDKPMLVVLEDLHWADPDTLSVCEYLVDHVSDTPLVSVATARDAEMPSAALAMVRRARTLHLLPLSPEEVELMAADCLGGHVPPEVIDRLRRQAAGLPLLVEDLLGGEEATRFEDLVCARVAGLPPRSQRIVVAAALVGERFDWHCLRSAIGEDEGDVSQALDEAIAVQLVVPDGRGFQFRHALTRDAVLTSVPRLASALSAPVARALEASGREDDLVRAAELWAQADETDRSATLLLRAGRAAAGRGAPLAAADLMRRAADLGPHEAIRRDIELTRLQHLAAHGHVDEALSVGAGLLDTTAESEAVHRSLARALLDAGRAPDALAHINTMGHGAERLALLARATLATTAADRRLGAEHLAHHALAAAESEQQAAVACEALEIVARCARSRSLADAESALQRALAIAEQAGLSGWRLRILNELGTVEMLRAAEGGRLARAHEQAMRAGALDLAVGIDVNIAALHAMRGELEEAKDVAQRAEESARRLGLQPLVAAAIVIEALSDGFRGRREGMERRLRAAEALAPGDSDLHAFGTGAGRGLCALVREEREEATSFFRRAIQPLPPVGSLDTAHGPLLLVLAASGVGTEEDLQDAKAVATPGAGWSDLWVGYGEAALRRSVAVFEAADVAARRHPLFRAVGLRLLSEAALRDAWGDPVEWLREAEAAFVVGGQDRIGGACRALLRRARASATRRRGQDRELRPDLLRRGLTAREAEVLELVAERLGNKEIATRLFVSPRTVEKHVANLLSKLGAADRRELVGLARNQPSSMGAEHP